MNIKVLVVLAAVALGAARPAGAQLPLEPARETGQGVTGAFEGWYKNPDGTFTLVVGYFNRNRKETLEIPVGPNNRIEPGGPDWGQSTVFLPRRQWGVFTITVPADFGDQTLTWTLVANGQTTSIPLSLHPLWVIDPWVDAVKNTPPRVRLDPGGPEHQGPPRGIAATFSAAVALPLTLTLWADDDRVPVLESGRPKKGPPITIAWSRFRGPDAVTFTPADPPVGEPDGKTTTTVVFGAPGEYILRAQINDWSGDGGGGAQCCWTSVHVKVAVQPAPSSNQP